MIDIIKYCEYYIDLGVMHMMPYEGLIIDYNQDGWGQIAFDTHLGGGAYGDVFKGIEVGSSREVTVKVIRNVDSDIEEYRVKNEASVDIECEHIVPVISSKKWHDKTTWVMLFKYFDAENLSEIVERRESKPIAHVEEYTKQLIIALHAAHKNNIIHRDIKPANILISGHSESSPGRLLVIDFGVSKFRAGESMTIPGVPVGTKPYMCPYVLVNGGFDATFSADIFSFGITTAFMFLGKHPWVSTEIPTVKDNVEYQTKTLGQDTMVDLTLLDGDLRFKKLIEACTKLEPSHRTKQWNEIASHLGLELDLESVGEKEFNGKCHLMNISGENEGGVIPIELSDGDRVVLGRDKISITNKRISRQHIMSSSEENKLSITDMDSKNGTWLDGEKLAPESSKEASDGSKLRVEDMFIEIKFE